MAVIHNPFFDAIRSIQSTKEYWWTTEKQNQYNPIGINIGLSQHIDSVLFVNEMNKYWQVLSDKMHYDYLFNTIRKMRRQYSKWAKKTKSEDVQMLMKEFQVNANRAREYLALLTPEQLTEIRESRELGTVR